MLNTFNNSITFHIIIVQYKHKRNYTVIGTIIILRYIDSMIVLLEYLTDLSQNAIPEVGRDSIIVLNFLVDMLHV